MTSNKKRPVSHRDFFEFQNRIYAIIAEYEISDLESFLSTSSRSFPHLAKIVKEMIYLARSGESRDGRKGYHDRGSPETELARIDSKEFYPSMEPVDVEMAIHKSLSSPVARSKQTQRRKLRVVDILNSRKVFPTNEDLGRYSEKVLNLRIGWKWDSRKNMVSKMLKAIKSMPTNKKKKIIKHLQETAIKKGLALDAVEVNGFFTAWERVISDQAKTRE